MIDREVWYRMNDCRYSVADEWGDHAYTQMRVEMREYPVLRHTPKGVWLDDYSERGRFVLRDARRRWACPTREDAVESFLARKRRQAGILNARLEMVRSAIAHAEALTAVTP